jgi:major type 1 subunit fimbrin (pilin)
MHMKKVNALLFALLNASISPVFAVDGAISFHGSIITQACEVNNGEDVDVELGTFSAAQFTAVGEKSPSIPFVLPLTNCPVAAAQEDPVPHFRLWLETETVPGHDDLAMLGNDFEDTMADGVGVKIVDATTKKAMPYNVLPPEDMEYQSTAATLNINLLAYYVSYKEPKDITAGPADARVNVTLDYR